MKADPESFPQQKVSQQFALAPSIGMGTLVRTSKAELFVANIQDDSVLLVLSYLYDL